MQVVQKEHTHLLRTALAAMKTWQATPCAQLEHDMPCVKLWITLEKSSQRARHFLSQENFELAHETWKWKVNSLC